MDVLQTAADAGLLGIDVDMNQNHLHPGRVLISILKQVDSAVFFAFQEALLHKSAEGRASAFPGHTYPTGCVMGMPRAV